MIKNLCCILSVWALSLASLSPLSAQESEQKAAVNYPDTAAASNAAIPSELITSPENPILLMFTASWCAPCHRMMKTVFPDEKVKAFLKKYNVVLLDIDTPFGSSLERRFCDERVVPYFFILDSSQKQIASQKGASDSPEAFAAFLERGLPVENLSDALSQDKFDAIVSADYKKAVAASSEAVQSRWRAGVLAGAGIGNLTNSGTGARFEYMVSLYGRYSTFNGTAFRAGLQYTPSTGLGVPLDLSFRIGKAFNLGFGTGPSFILTKADRYKAGYQLKKFDIAARVGAAYQINSFRIGVLYNYGLVNQRKDNDLLEKGLHNQFVLLTFSYDIF